MSSTLRSPHSPHVAGASLTEPTEVSEKKDFRLVSLISDIQSAYDASPFRRKPISIVMDKELTPLPC